MKSPPAVKRPPRLHENIHVPDWHHQHAPAIPPTSQSNQTVENKGRLVHRIADNDEARSAGLPLLEQQHYRLPYQKTSALPQMISPATLRKKAAAGVFACVVLAGELVAVQPPVSDFPPLMFVSFPVRELRAGILGLWP